MVVTQSASLAPDKLYFSLAGIVFEMISDTKLELDSDFLPFLILPVENMISPACTVTIQSVNELHYDSLPIAAEDYDNSVSVRNERCFERRFHLPGKKEVYAVSNCNDLCRTEIHYLETAVQNVKRLRQSFRMSCWEGAMIRNNRLLLHASLIDSAYGGLLFAGPSGMGKSTQAELWERFRSARLVNGDRPILYKSENWLACGSPLAGSSHCCLNEEIQIRAITVLEQAPVCRVTRLSGAEAFRVLYSLTTVYYWSKEYVDRVITMLQELISDIPVYRLACTPDEAAVETLEMILKEETENGRA